MPDIRSTPEPDSTRLYRHQLETLTFEASDKLTSWESNFIASLEVQLDKHGKLSEKQIELLNNLYERYC